MNKSISSLLFALVSVAVTGTALADTAGTESTRVIQVAAANPVTPVMSHDVATIIKLSHKAQAQYRRTGSPQDLARVNAMQVELASRGFGRTTTPAPAMLPATSQLATMGHATQQVASAN
jgi:hypothetical protein